MTPAPDDARLAPLLSAILSHVPFDGWSEAAWSAAVQDAQMTETEARALCPRGAVDLAAAYHRAGDHAMLEKLAATDLAQMRYSDRVARAIALRLADTDREVVRRGTALFALPNHAAEGAALIWGTADAVWNALGDTSRDGNWYSKRAILSAVYGSVVLFWLGDQSDGSDTKAFTERRIADVMRFEKFKSDARKSPILGPIAAGLGRMMEGIKAPQSEGRDDLPGRWTEPDAGKARP